MAKLSVKHDQELRERVRAFNEKEALEAFKQVGTYEEVPAEVKNLLTTHALPRVGKARVVPFAYISSLEGAEYHGEQAENSCFIAIMKYEKFAFPTMFIYWPQYEQELQRRRFELICEKALEAFKNVAPCDEVPEDVKEVLANAKLPHIGKAKLATYAYISKLEGAEYYGLQNVAWPFVATVKNEENNLITLFIYSPSWESTVARNNIIIALRTRLKKMFDLSLPADIEEIIRGNEDFKYIPKNVFFEGCRARFDNRANTAGNTVYNNLIVEHQYNGESAWTIFVPAIDYKSRWAITVANKTNVPMDVAEKISAAWDHSFIAAINMTVYTDAEQYAADMVSRNELTADATVMDLLQGELSVISKLNDDNSVTLQIDIDDELPSAVFVKNQLNIFMPGVSE